jgi:heat shock protein HslJ
VRHLVFGLVMAALGVSVLACSSSGGSSGGGTGGTLDNTSWILSSYVAGGTTTPIPSGVVVDATFKDSKVSGSAGCNAYNASATTDGAKLTIGTPVATQKLCAQDVMTIESAYFAAIGSVATYTATADALTLYDSSGKLLLTYAAGAANPLVGSWSVTGYNNGKQAVVSPIAGSTLNAVFTADLQATGFAGCNDYSGSYKLDGSNLTVGPLVSTKKACEQAVMDQEAAFLTALQTPTTVETSGGIVTLRAANGETQVVLAPQ